MSDVADFADAGFPARRGMLAAIGRESGQRIRVVDGVELAAVAVVDWQQTPGLTAAQVVAVIERAAARFEARDDASSTA